MKWLIAAALTLAVFAALHIPVLKKHKRVICALYAVGMTLFFAVYNFRTLDLIISTYHPTDQTLYQKEFLSTGEYADAFLEEFLKGRKVYTPDDEYTDKDEYTLYGGKDFDELGNYWLYHQYHAVNMWNFLDLCGASVIKDDTLNGTVLSDEQRSYYENLGPANDLMRYTFLLSPYSEEWGNGFYYYWFYNDYTEISHVYICPQDIADADELVLIWQQEDLLGTEDYFIASKQYYDEVIAK
ncbi:MAG: hypothetical protein K6E49_06320 [Lachnospiraceae bacterium]|nr:hypothetical protein [Lachnospiraceae bacterium]